MATVLPVAADGGGCDVELAALSDAPPAANRGKRASSPAGLEPYRAQAEAPAASQLPAVDGEGAAPLDGAHDGGGEMKAPDSPRYEPAEPVHSEKARTLWTNVRQTIFEPGGLHSAMPVEYEAKRRTEEIVVKVAPSKPPNFVRNRHLLVHPEGDLRLYWDLIQIVALVYVSLMVPLRMGLSWSAIGAWFIIESIIDAYFIADVAFSFTTAVFLYDEQGAHLCSDRRKIASSYVRGYFLIDILACAPIDQVQRGLVGKIWCSYKIRNPCSPNVTRFQAFKLLKVLRMFRLLKLLRLFRLRRLFLKYQDRVLDWMPVISSMKLCLVLVFASHWMGCVYASVYKFQESDKATTNWEKWVACVYWAMQTITTVGYGDLTSKNTDARLVATAAMAVGGLIFGWLIQYVLTVVNPDTFEHKQQARLERVVRYLRANGLSKDVSLRVVRHVRNQNSRQREDKSVLTEIPRQLRAEICLELYSDVTRRVPFFAGAGDAFVTEICTHLAPLTTPAGDLIYSQSDPADALYVVLTGRVAVLVRPDMDPRDVLTQHGRYGPEHVTQRRQGPAKPKLITTLESGAVFGEGGLCDLDRRLETTKAAVTADLLTVDGEDMKRALSLAPNLHWRLVKKHAHLVVKSLGETRPAAQCLLRMNLPDLVRSTDIFNDLTLRDRIRAFTRAKVTVKEDWRECLIASRTEWERRHFGVGATPAGAPSGPRPSLSNDARASLRARVVEVALGPRGRCRATRRSAWSGASRRASARRPRLDDLAAQVARLTAVATAALERNTRLAPLASPS
ncbi:voltage-gated potassium channel [Aureococcus anophagefferens]|uniref:Voltage-gated potassium channel n=1 Tax=Aureococcus anophagefferens TaxID=44056 RepID=A0ABR1G8V5_AURAN